MHPTSTRKLVAQACDACRRRKIKCNGLQPCPSCRSAELPCNFTVTQRRGGNRGARATILNELRGCVIQGGNTNPSSPVESIPTSQGHPTSSYHVRPSTSPSSTKVIQGNTIERSLSLSSAGTLETGAIDMCITAYLERIYPVVPFLTADILRTEALHSSASLLSRQFIVSFCAYVVTFGKVLDEVSLFSSHTSASDLGTQLLNTALRIQVPERVSTPTRQSVFISFFLYGSYAGLGNYRQGWFYLREATTLFMMQKSGEDGEGWYSRDVYRCLFWVLVISERAHAIRKNRPITLQVTSSSPSLIDAPSRGLQYLASLFRPFDEVFFAVWNGSRQECSKEWLLGLERDVRTALPVPLSVSSEQISNLRVSQLWLQIKLWELFPRFGFLSSESVYECLTFRYPITVARDLSVLAIKLPIGSLQIHGVGMTEKIFDIACALADVLPFVSTATSQLELGPVDFLTSTTSLLAKLPDGEAKFVPLLLAKVNELLPELVKGLCEAVQIQVPPLLEGPMSPDSRFVYEEEVGRGLYADLRRGR